MRSNVFEVIAAGEKFWYSGLVKFTLFSFCEYISANKIRLLTEMLFCGRVS